MAKSMMEIWSQLADPLLRLRALGIGYVKFALAYPAYLRVMFGAEVPDKAAYPTLNEAADRTFEMLVQAIAEAQAVGQVRRGDPEGLAIAAWSLIHGLAALLVDGKLKDQVRSAKEAEEMAERVTEAFMLGLAPADPSLQ